MHENNMTDRDCVSNTEIANPGRIMIYDRSKRRLRSTDGEDFRDSILNLLKHLQVEKPVYAAELLRLLFPLYRTADIQGFPHYLTHFGPLRLVGKGGFGAVYKAKHILDDRPYAIKVVSRLKSSEDLERARSEVLVMSKLNHENVIRYVTSWIEPYGDVHEGGDLSTCLTASIGSSDAAETISSMSWRRRRRHTSSSVSQATAAPAATTSAFAKDEASQSDAESLRWQWRRSPQTNVDDSDSERSTSHESTGSESGSGRRRHGSGSRPSLFIQLEWCQASLADWLEVRSTLQLSYGIGFAVPQSSVRWLMDQVVRGVAYLHSRRILHRDLKPANVLLKGPPLNRISTMACFCRPGLNLARACGGFGSAGTLLLPPEVTGSEPPGWLPCYHYLVVKICDFGLTTILDSAKPEEHRPHGPTGTTAAAEDCLESPTPNRSHSTEDLSQQPAFSRFACGRLGQFFHEPRENAFSRKLMTMTQWRSQQRHRYPGQWSNRLLTANLGSALYTAPEVKTDAGASKEVRLSYGYPADIYSLGVIFVQMLHTCGTVHELIAILQRLSRSGEGSDSSESADLLSSIRSSWPLETELVVRMLSPSADLRPTARELLSTLCHTSEFYDLTHLAMDTQRTDVPTTGDSATFPPPPPPPTEASYVSDEAESASNRDSLETMGRSPTPVRSSWTHRYISDLLCQIREIKAELADTRLRLARYEPTV